MKTRKMLAVLLTIVMVFGNIVSLYATPPSVMQDAHRDTTYALQGIGVELELNICDAAYDGRIENQDMPPSIVRFRNSLYAPLSISTEADVDILMSALELVFELTDASIHIDGAILRALDESGLRMYWQNSIMELLYVREELEENYMRVAPFGGWLSIQRTTVRPWETLPIFDRDFWGTTTFEYVLSHRRVSSGGIHAALDTGVFWLNRNSFQFFNVYGSAYPTWRTAHGMIIARGQPRFDDYLFAVRVFGDVGIEVSGHVQFWW